VGLRLLAPALALTAVIAGMGGAGGLAFTVLLVAIVGASARGLVAVGEAAEARAGLAPIVLAGVSLLAVLTAAATRTPGVAVLSIVALGIEELGSVRARRPVTDPS
jgi:hypothetical protein